MESEVDAMIQSAPKRLVGREDVFYRLYIDLKQLISASSRAGTTCGKRKGAKPHRVPTPAWAWMQGPLLCSTHVSPA